jgi:hypothetical protein
VTNLTCPAERVVALYNQRGTAEQWIKEGKNAVIRTHCRTIASRPTPFSCNRMRWPTISVKHWSLTTLHDRLVKIGAKIVRHGRSVIFQMAEVMVPLSVPASPGCHRRAAPIAVGLMLSAAAGLGRAGCRRRTAFRRA